MGSTLCSKEMKQPVMVMAVFKISLDRSHEKQAVRNKPGGSVEHSGRSATSSSSVFSECTGLMNEILLSVFDMFQTDDSFERL